MVDLSVVVTVFPVIFLGELPDKTMFASLVLASRGRPIGVWLGAALAFTVHVALAVTVGVGLIRVLPPRVVEALVAGVFAAAAAWAILDARRAEKEEELVDHEIAAHRIVPAAFLVIFVAEWGDLTQVLTAGLAARSGAPLEVAVGAVLALWSVAALAVVAGQGLLRFVSVTALRRLTAGALVGLALYSAWRAVTG